MKRFYSLLLYLFPKAYREEYGDELQAVFGLSLDDALATGSFEFLGVILRELRGFPYAVFHAHLRERRRQKMTGKFASRFDFEPGSRTESFAALAPFLFGMVMVLAGYLGRYWTAPMWAQIAFVVLFWSLILGVFLLGSAKGLPRWFLPYLGLPLAIASLLLFNILVNFLDIWWYRSYGFESVFNFGNFLWIILIILVFLLLAISRLVPMFRPFYQRLRDDWTLLPFMLYGTVPFVLVITFEGYVNDEPFFFLSLLLLALGGWFYLRNDEPLTRFVSLHVGLALSMLTAAVGKAVLFKESWPQVFDLTWKNEMIYTLVTWLWLAVIMLIPLAIKLLPRSVNPPREA